MLETNSQLKSFIDRIERLSEEKSGIQSDIKDIFDEAKSSGFNKKAMREVIKLRKMAREERQEQEELVQLYGAALGLE